MPEIHGWATFDVMGAQVLVVDDDPEILRILREVLIKRGFAVDTARDGDEAYDRAIARPPDLLVTDVMMPKLDGWSLVRKLRLDPKLAHLPVIFLTSVTTDDARVKAFRLGADDYVNKPFKFTELVQRIEKVLRARHGPPPSSEPAASGLAGDLAHCGLSTLLVLIEMERKNGVLRLQTTDGRSGQISLREGRVIDANVSGSEQPVGAEAVYVMLTWSSGKFELVVCKVDGPDRVQRATTHILMEGARVMDEASAPAAEAQLDVEAIAEWSGDEPTPVVVAAKLADLVRRTARASNPPYTVPRGGTPMVAEARSLVEVEDAAEPEQAEVAEPEPADAAEPEPHVPLLAVAVPAEIVPAPKPVARELPARLAVPRVRRPSPWWIVAGLVIAGAGAATFVIEPRESRGVTNEAELRGDADAIASAIDRAADTAQLRADGIAAMPLLRFGIETDAATLEDTITNEMTVEPAAGEVIEVFQLRDGAAVSALRLPRTAPALALPAAGAKAGVDSDGKAMRVIATAPIKTRAGTDAGVFAVARAIDLTGIQDRLAQHVRGARVVGLARPVELVAPPAGGEAPAPSTVPITTRAGMLSLEVRAPASTVSVPPRWLEPARYASFALGGLLLLIYSALAVVSTRNAARVASD